MYSDPTFGQEFFLSLVAAFIIAPVVLAILGVFNRR